MSMKRAKPVTRGKNRDSDLPSFLQKPPEKALTWEEDVVGKADESFVPYAMNKKFARGTLLLHPKFGKGVVSLVEGARIEVLFEDGPKKLGHTP